MVKTLDAKKGLRERITGPIPWVLGLIIFGIGIFVGRLLLPNSGPCSLDWIAVGTWVGSIGVVVAGVVALWQLQNFRSNERYKATIDYIGSFGTVKVALGGDVEFTAAESATVVTTGALNIPIAEEGKQLSQNPNAVANEDNKRKVDYYFRVSSAAVIVIDYFRGAYFLILRNLIDADLFFAQFGADMDQLHSNTRTLSDWNGRPMKEFTALNELRKSRSQH